MLPDRPLLLPTPRRLVRLAGTLAVPHGFADAVAAMWADPAAAAAGGVRAVAAAAGGVDGGEVEAAAGHPLLGIAIDHAVGPGPEAYTLMIDPAATPPVRVRANGVAGVRHALATLGQLLRQYAALPALAIEDAPVFAVRGVMLDASRDAVPTMASLYRTIDLLASLKYNHLQLYTEHTFAYEGHEAAWRGWSPVTPEEARSLDAYCRGRGIDLAPNQNCFGHLSHWLGLPGYAHLAETHGDWTFMDFPRSGPFSLCPIDPASGAFVADLLGQLLPCFSSGLVNIGCDETFDVGAGRSAAAVGERGRGAVYFEFVNTVAAIARSHGKRPMLWADIALHDPASLSMFPPGAVGLAWGYEPDSPFGPWCDALRGRGIEAWVCPGTSSWRSITGRTAERRANIAAGAEAGVLHGAAGFLLTDWGDAGHHQAWPIALNAIAQGAEAAWSPPGAAGFDPHAASLHALGDPSLQLGGWLDRLGDIDLPLRRSNGLRNGSAMFAGMMRHTTPRRVSATYDDWVGVLMRLGELERTRPRVDDALVGAELAHTLAYARTAVRCAVAFGAGRPLGAGAAKALADDVARVGAEHRRLWGRRNRPGGLDHSLSHFQKVVAEVRSLGGAPGAGVR